MYFGGRIAVNAIAFFVLVALIGFFVDGGTYYRRFNKLFFVPVLLYVLYFISLFYSYNSRVAFFDLQVNLSLILLPVLFGFEKKNPKINVNTVLMLYSFASLFIMSLLIVLAFTKYFTTGIFPRYLDFSVFIHTSYLSMYLVFNILVNYYLFRNKSGKPNPNYLLLSILFSVVAVFLSDSKTGIITVLIVLSIILFNYLSGKSKRIAWITQGVIILLVSIIAITNPRFSIMLNFVKNYDKIINQPDRYVESTGERIMAWDASVKLIKDNFWFGVGIGDSRDALHDKYVDLHYLKPAELRLNSHNQYLETFLSIGIFGFALLLLFLILPLMIVKGDLRLLLTGFITVIAINFLSESMFKTQAGVIFIMFIYSLLISYKTPRKILSS